MRGRKPKLTFSEMVRLRTIQAAFGIGSKEEDAFWENVRKAAKLRREIRRGSVPSSRPRKGKNMLHTLRHTVLQAGPITSATATRSWRIEKPTTTRKRINGGRKDEKDS